MEAIGLREGSANGHEITLCKAVPDDRGADLGAIRAVVNGSSVEVAGPAGNRWAGYLIVRSPHGSHVNLSATNGPVRADSFDGQLNVRTTNGPIALMHVRGKVTARAENGPVKIEGDGGNVSVETQNGPIGVRLMGTQWQTGDLVARAQNGPLSVELPDQYRSGVEIESSGHSPWSCDVDCGTRDNNGRHAPGTAGRRSHACEAVDRERTGESALRASRTLSMLSAVRRAVRRN